MSGEEAGGGEPTWLTPDLVLAIHDEQIAEHGGAPGVRDAGLMESALARPRNRHAYGETDLVALAASLAVGLARNHPFVDGNKRTAFVAAVAFVEINGGRVEAKEAEAVAAMLDLAAGTLPEEGFAAWLRDNARAGNQG